MKAFYTPYILALLLGSSLPAWAENFNYAEALQKSIYFYDAQRSGKLPADNRVDWRGDSALKDGSDLGVDLTGGFYDAGDNVKFNFPMAANTSELLWSMIEFKDGYKNTGQYPFMLSNARWATDYLLKTWDNTNQRLYAQISSSKQDHDKWIPAETIDAVFPDLKKQRSTLYLDKTKGGSDLAGATAAALVAGYLVFKDEDPGYAQQLLTAGEQVYLFAVTYQKKYSDSLPAAGNEAYPSYDFKDELAFAAAFLYRATGQPKYLTDAKKYTDLSNNEGTYSWDDSSYAFYVLMATLLDEKKYTDAATKWLDAATKGSKAYTFTPGGLFWTSDSTWASLPYACDTAFLALVYAKKLEKNDATRAKAYRAFAQRQIDYVLGDNPRKSSYVVGFGNNPPQNPHHATAHGSWSDDINSPKINKHILYGALVGGPDKKDAYKDDRNDFEKNEVAYDYNGGLVGSLAALNELCMAGKLPQQPAQCGQALPNFPEPSKRDLEYFVGGYVLSKTSDAQSTKLDLQLQIHNHSSFPARITNNLACRYYVNLNDMPADKNPSQVKVELHDSDAKIKASELLPLDASKKLYYVQISFNDIKIYPAGRDVSRKEAKLKLTFPWKHDVANDWSFGQFDSKKPSDTTNMPANNHITVYDNNVLLYGQAPQ